MDLTKLRDAWRKRAAELRSRASIVISAAYRALEAEAQGYTNCADELDAALAARPVRAVLTEDAVREAWREWWNKQPGVEERTMFQRIQQAFYAGAALDRQHAKPPEDAAVEEAIDDTWGCAQCGRSGFNRGFYETCPYCGGRLVFGAKP